MISQRLFFFIISGMSVLLIFAALALQYLENIAPCPMCILQRFAFIAIGIITFIAGIHNPSKSGKFYYYIITISCCLAGGGVSIRHLYLENNPPQLFDCGADLGYLLEAFPLTKIFPMIFRGTGDCSEVPWTFMGMSLAAWALAWFIIFTVSIILFGFLKHLRPEKPI